MLQSACWNYYNSEPAPPGLENVQNDALSPCGASGRSARGPALSSVFVGSGLAAALHVERARTAGASADRSKILRTVMEAFKVQNDWKWRRLKR
jgi:hypothetical protein